jgi:undecaprenyl-diphosphatase
MAALTIACEGWALTLLAAAFVGWRERSLRGTVQVLAPLYLGLALASLVVQVVKELAATPRPLAVLGPAVHVQLEPLLLNGFPSGHSAAVASVAVFALSRYRSRAWPLAVLAVLGGISRVYVGAHWVTDVLGGWALGALAALVATPLLEAATRGVRALRAARGGGAGSGAGGGRARMEPLPEPEIVGLEPKPEPVDGERP